MKWIVLGEQVTVNVLTQHIALKIEKNSLIFPILFFSFLRKLGSILNFGDLSVKE